MPKAPKPCKPYVPETPKPLNPKPYSLNPQIPHAPIPASPVLASPLGGLLCAASGQHHGTDRGHAASRGIKALMVYGFEGLNGLRV